MQLAPRYTERPLITLDGDPSAIGTSTIAQRRRLVGIATGLSDDELAAPSRCDGWSVADVLAHLDGTNRFWSMSIAGGLTGEPTRILDGFDPVATPAAMVEGGRTRAGAEVVEAFVDSSTHLLEDVVAVEPSAWEVTAEAPPGHMTLSAVVHHALWDAWVHERDILLPLGVEPAVERDEVIASLRYAAALSPAIGRTMGERRTGQMTVSGAGPDVAFRVTVDDDVTVAAERADVDDTPPADVHGSTLALLEAFSARGPFPVELPDACSWMLDGLAKAFDQA